MLPPWKNSSLTNTNEFEYCASGPGYSKIVKFCRTEAGLTSKWGRISPAVYQNQSRYIVKHHATLRDVI